jgi:hypothetical protein
MKDFETLAKEAGVALTPDMQILACLVRQDTLISFWESAERQAKTQRDSFEGFLVLVRKKEDQK